VAGEGNDPSRPSRVPIVRAGMLLLDEIGAVHLSATPPGVVRASIGVLTASAALAELAGSRRNPARPMERLCSCGW
jgi:hypothetical protein